MRYLLAFLFVAAAGSSFAEPAAKPIKVGLYLQINNNYYQGHHRDLRKILTFEAGFECEVITPEALRAGALDGLDLLIMPGGSGSKQAAMLEDSGREIIRRFVKTGGGYLGICAGAYLATNDYPWSIGLLNAKVVDRKNWARGKGDVSLEITQEGKRLFAVEASETRVSYRQGPLLAAGASEELPAYIPLATYLTEIVENGATPGAMPGSTAIAKTTFGAGRVICFSPHPELPDGPNELILQGARWAGSGKDQAK